MKKDARRVCMLLGVFVVLCCTRVSVAQEQAPLRWLSDVNVAYQEALARKRPILIRVVGESCSWCRKLEGEILKPQVQRDLAAWTLVSIDIDRSPDDAKRLHVSGIPALRALTPRGRIVASQDGFLESKELRAWLQESFEEANSAPDAVLLSDHEPSLLEIVRIVRLFNNRDAELREAAIRRLLPFRQATAGAVVNSLQEGNLSSRLVAHELLNEWKAPLGKIDPWRPETLTDEQFAAVEEWLSRIDALPAPGGSKELTEEERLSVGREIELMLKADRTEAAAVRERIARFGPAVLPQVLSRLDEAASDEDRKRLVTLRYRLVAADGLVLAWPGGLERLADTDASVRHQAAQDLAAMATADEQTLLLELFSDPDSLVREISLRGLRNVGGEQATAALVTLLNDPEPNVRAAVLKQLAEDSSPEMLSEVAEYVKQEEDADLVVHAIRYFRETASSKAVPTLLALLQHDSWQVRAEAAEAIGKTLGRSSYGSGRSANDTIEIYDALLKLLADSDAFVVSRALNGLSAVDAKRAVEPLVKAAAAHPSLASQIVELLANGSRMREPAVPHLRVFFTQGDPAVRAAAIRGLCKTDPENVQTDLLAAVRDKHTLVRTSAATSLLELIDESRPEPHATGGGFGSDAFANSQGVEANGLLNGLLKGLFGGPQKPPAEASTEKKEDDNPTEPEAGETSESSDPEADAEPESKPKAEPKPKADPDRKADAEPESQGKETPKERTNPIDTWLAELYSGQHRFDGMSELQGPLQEMLQAEEAKERLAAALVLIPFGDADRALPVLLAVAAEEPALFSRSAEALKWLVWQRRAEMFWLLYEVARNETERSAVAHAMNQVPDFRITEVYWRALNRPDATQPLAEVMQRGLQEAYFGTRYYDASSITTRMRKRAVTAVMPQLKEGPPLKRLVAIDLLLKISPDEAVEAANTLMADSSAEAGLRSDAFQITLAAQTKAQRTNTAIESLAGSDTHRRAVVLKFLAIGPSSLAQLPATGFTIDFEDDGTSRSYNSGQPIIPEPPRRLEARHVAPFIDDADPQNAAYAGYLLAMFQNPDGLGPLLSYWRSQDVSDELDRLVYRAIAVLDDPQYTPALKQIYARLNESEKREFYWTVRIMSGKEILAFRKQMREEIGMSNLK